MALFGSTSPSYPIMSSLDIARLWLEKNGERKTAEALFGSREHEGSLMFDEYPDQLQLHLMGRRVYDRAEKDQVIEKLIRSEGKGADESWIRDLIQVMLYQEIYKRRSDQRKYNQKYYQGIAFPKG